MIVRLAALRFSKFGSVFVDGGQAGSDLSTAARHPCRHDHGDYPATVAEPSL